MSKKHKDTGRIGLSIKNGSYKLCTIKVDMNDGSFYICSSLGSYYKNRGLAPAKITYHPDGKSWITSDLQLKIVGKDFIDSSHKAPMKGVDVSSAGHIHVRKHRNPTLPSYDDIEARGLVVRLDNCFEYYDIHTIDHPAEVFQEETSAEKLKMTDMILAEGYTGIALDFFIAPKRRGMISFTGKTDGTHKHEQLTYEHPTRDLRLVVGISNIRVAPENN